MRNVEVVCNRCATTIKEKRTIVLFSGHLRDRYENVDLCHECGEALGDWFAKRSAEESVETEHWVRA